MFMSLKNSLSNMVSERILDEFLFLSCSRQEALSMRGGVVTSR